MTNPEIIDDNLSPDELWDGWPILSDSERVEGLTLLSRDEGEDLFLRLDAPEQAHILLALPRSQQRSWMRLLPPDDAADLIQAADEEERERLLGLLDEPTRREVTALMAYADDKAGGLMSPRFARVRPDMTVDQAITYVRKQAREHLETIYYVYVLDREQRLLGVVSLRQLIGAPPDKKVSDIMTLDAVTVEEHMDQETVSRVFAGRNLIAVPVLDKEGRMKGIVTLDDIVDVVLEEATEDIQKLGGMEALEEPYLTVRFSEMIKKRAGWLSALFLGEMLTATAMAYFNKEIAAAVVLAIFMPLIISSGGNSGSQATTLVIRAMALGQVRLRDLARVMRRELVVGLSMGAILGVIGILRILAWHGLFGSYGEHYLLIGLTVGVSLVGVVMWGTLVGATLPFLLKAVGFDPASASAPMVATLVDVSGLVIYFSAASLILRGTLLP